MFKTTAIIATTHVDRHNEKMMPSALEGMRRQVDKNYIRSMWNHDIRYPPLGRSVAARVVTLDDGELGLEVDTEYWESGDALNDLKGDGRALRQATYDRPWFEVRIDRSLDPRDRHAVDALARLAGPRRRPDVVGKKALEPDPVLIFAVGAIVGSIAVGFLQRLGEDLYENVKRHLSELAASRRTKHLLIDFDITVERDGTKVVHVLLEDPTGADVEALLSGGFEATDIIIENALAHASDLVEIVMTWREGRMLFNYGLRSDGVPILTGRGIPAPIELGDL